MIHEECNWNADVIGIENVGNGYFIPANDLISDGFEDWFSHLKTKT